MTVAAVIVVALFSGITGLISYGLGMVKGYDRAAAPKPDRWIVETYVNQSGDGVEVRVVDSRMRYPRTQWVPQAAKVRTVTIGDQFDERIVTARVEAQEHAATLNAIEDTL